MDGIYNRKRTGVPWAKGVKSMITILKYFSFTISTRLPPIFAQINYVLNLEPDTIRYLALINNSVQSFKIRIHGLTIRLANPNETIAVWIMVIYTLIS